MPLAAVTATLITPLLGGFADTLAAAVQVPRMERVSARSWGRPGHNPLTGDVVAAIDRHIDIPTLVRIKLEQRMQAHDHDDLVEIRRDSISGRARYEPAIRGMHFGVDHVCHHGTREHWTAQMLERGLVYCEAGHCILVPTVCRNVSRIERGPSALAQASAGGPSDPELVVPPPSAGLPAADAGNASVDATAAPTAAVPSVAPATSTNTAMGPSDANTPWGGNGGAPFAGGGPGEVTGARDPSLPAWPVVSGD
jgi:hypothetical protein